MKLLHFSMSLAMSISKSLVSCLLVMMLVACGTNSTTDSSPGQIYAHGSAKKTANAFPSLAPNTVNIHVKQGGLLIQSTGGFQCPGSGWLSSYLMGQLMFASDRTTYSQDEIAQMRAYASASQFSCYELQGTTFVLIPAPTLSPNWCL